MCALHYIAHHTEQFAETGQAGFEKKSQACPGAGSAGVSANECKVVGCLRQKRQQAKRRDQSLLLSLLGTKKRQPPQSAAAAHAPNPTLGLTVRLDRGSADWFWLLKPP